MCRHLALQGGFLLQPQHLTRAEEAATADRGPSPETRAAARLIVRACPSCIPVNSGNKSSSNKAIEPSAEMAVKTLGAITPLMPLLHVGAVPMQQQQYQKLHQLPPQEQHQPEHQERGALLPLLQQLLPLVAHAAAYRTEAAAASTAQAAATAAADVVCSAAVEASAALLQRLVSLLRVSEALGRGISSLETRHQSQGASSGGPLPGATPEGTGVDSVKQRAAMTHGAACEAAALLALLLLQLQEGGSVSCRARRQCAAALVGCTYTQNPKPLNSYPFP